MTTATVEVVTDGGPDMVWASDLETVPVVELIKAKEAFALTKVCSCSTKRRFIIDTPGYPYDLRDCAVCGRSLGSV